MVGRGGASHSGEKSNQCNLCENAPLGLDQPEDSYEEERKELSHRSFVKSEGDRSKARATEDRQVTDCEVLGRGSSSLSSHPQTASTDTMDQFY